MSEAFTIALPVFLMFFFLSLIWWCYRYRQQRKLESAVTQAYRAYAANAHRNQHNMGPPPSISLISNQLQQSPQNQAYFPPPQQNQFQDLPPSYAEAQIMAAASSQTTNGPAILQVNNVNNVK